MPKRRSPREQARPASRRAELVEQVKMAGRVLSTATVMFHTALAEKAQLSATETKALDLLERFGPLTAGELVQRSGLAPASVTGLINRLEEKGFARRVPHPSDRRSVLVEMSRDPTAVLGPFFVDFMRSLDKLCAGYTDEQLEVILHFLTEAARIQSEATVKLTS